MWYSYNVYVGHGLSLKRRRLKDLEVKCYDISNLFSNVSAKKKNVVCICVYVSTGLNEESERWSECENVNWWIWAEGVCMSDFTVDLKFYQRKVK